MSPASITGIIRPRMPPGTDTTPVVSAGGIALRGNERQPVGVKFVPTEKDA